VLPEIKFAEEIFINFQNSIQNTSKAVILIFDSWNKKNNQPIHLFVLMRRKP
jgi:hypothetical protein